MAESDSTLTDRQMHVLRLRNDGHSQEEIALKFGTTKQNISAIEKMARKNIERAENTIKFIKTLEAPVWFDVAEGTRPQTQILWAGACMCSTTVLRSRREFGISRRVGYGTGWR